MAETVWRTNEETFCGGEGDRQGLYTAAGLNEHRLLDSHRMTACLYMYMYATCYGHCDTDSPLRRFTSPWTVLNVAKKLLIMSAVSCIVHHIIRP